MALFDHQKVVGKALNCKKRRNRVRGIEWTNHRACKMCFFDMWSYLIRDACQATPIGLCIGKGVCIAIVKGPTLIDPDVYNQALGMVGDQ